MSICKFTQTFRGVLEELPNFLRLDNDRQNSTKSKLTGNPKPCYNEKIHPDKFIITMCLFSPNRTQQAKRTFLHRCKNALFRCIISIHPLAKRGTLLELASLCSLRNSYGNGYSSANHRVVAQDFSGLFYYIHRAL